MTRPNKRRARFGKAWAAAEFEGVIDERDGNNLWVRLIDLATDREYFAEMDLQTFPEHDRPLCEPGALFIIGRRGRQPYVTLRWKKPWTQADIDRINAEAEELWQRLKPIMEPA